MMKVEGVSMRFLLGAITTSTAAIFGSAAALAEAGQPVPWQMGMQDSVTVIGDGIHWLHNALLMPIITVVTLVVLGLLIYVSLKFNSKANPTPSKVTHNTAIEIVWTVVPILILLIIAIPSFRLLYLQRVIPPSDLTIKATGNQWNWSYEYPELGEDVSFTAFVKPDNELKDGEPRLLTADTPVVVPVNKVVRMIVTSSDVIHAWAMPSFGAKIDAIPGRLNELWFKAEKEGVYHGQCSELCGKDHAFMPIEVHVVSQSAYESWVKTIKTAGLDKANEKIYADLAAKRKITAQKTAQKMAVTQQ